MPKLREAETLGLGDERTEAHVLRRLEGFSESMP